MGAYSIPMARASAPRPPGYQVVLNCTGCPPAALGAAGVARLVARLLQLSDRAALGKLATHSSARDGAINAVQFLADNGTIGVKTRPAEGTAFVDVHTGGEVRVQELQDAVKAALSARAVRVQLLIRC